MSWATIPEAASHLGWSEYAVRKAIRTGNIPHIFPSGRYLVDLEMLDEHLRNEAIANQQKAREKWTTD